MQSNTVKILRDLDYEEVEAYLLNYHVISFDDRKHLTNKTSREQKLFVIEKVVKGTEDTFNNFLKALKECENDSNHELMLHIQQDHKNEESASKEPYCQSEILNTPYGSMSDELVLGEMSFQAQFSLQRNNSKIEVKASSHSSQNVLHNGLSNQYKTKTEKPVPAVSLNSQRPSLPTNTVSDPPNILEASDSWVVVSSHANIIYFKNLALVMEHICDEVIESLMGTNCVQSTFAQIINISASIKLPKEVYLAADPKTVTRTTRAADDQIKQSYKDLMRILRKLQSTSHPRINIDLDPTLKKIHYSPNQVILSDCSIENLIHAVKKLNQATTHWSCMIL